MSDVQLLDEGSQEGDLKIWWVPQVPMKPFEVCVSSFEEAKTILRILAEYDFFQYKNNIKPDYCNKGGLVVFENGKWVDFISDDNDLTY